MAQNLKYIPYSQSYYSSLPQLLKANQSSLYNHLISTDIKLYVDKDKALQNFNCSNIFNIKESHINGKLIFAQIQGRLNIAEPLNDSNDDDYDNLDVLEKTESKYLQGDEDYSKKYEKIIWKLEFTDGVQNFFGFEYEPFNQRERSILKENSNEYIKVFLGPNIEIRRGIFYLSNKNFNIL